MSVSAARRDHRSFRQYDIVNPIEHRTNLANAGTVHDGRFPHADEVVRRQLVFHYKALQRAETTEGLEQWFETSICFPALFEDLACVNEGLGKSLLIIRF